MNSFRGVQRALDYEIKRQKTILERGGQVSQETRLWSEPEGKTYRMRGKEESGDYRYFPEPDLLPVAVNGQWIEEIRQRLPELHAFFVGQVMKKSKGKADPQLINHVLEKQLSKE